MSLDLAYSEFGAGDPVIILHGLFGCKRNWAGIGKDLGQSHHVFTLDLRNHGSSPHAPDMTYANMMADVEHFIESRHFGPTSIIGHSMGGKTAMTLALTRPDLVERMIVLDIAPVPYTHEYSHYIETMQGIDLARVTRRADVEPAINAVAESAQVGAFLMRNLVSTPDGGYRWRINLDAIEAHMADILDFPRDELNDSYDGKTLFLGGRQSDYIAATHASEIKRLFPKADVDFIDGAGHWVHAEQPKRVLERFRNFLD